MKLKFLFIAFLFCSLGFAQSKGTIKGTVTDKDMGNEPMPFVSVAIKGTTIGGNTDDSGKYSLSVPAGSHTLVFAFLGYETIEIPVTIAAGETKTIDQALGSTSVEMETVVIEATVNREKESALLIQQKEAVEIKQSIGAEEISRKGISNVEEGLTKITGVSKVESRGLIIRGLEDRYNNLLINGFAVPSNSPFNKIVPLDLFPTDVVGYMDIFKTFNPDIYGDFAGATVNINTSQPSQSRTKVNFGVGYTTENNLDDFLIASDARNTSTFFGYGGKNRQLPGVFGDTPAGRSLTPAQSKEELRSGFNVEKISSPLNTSFGVTHSGRFDLKNQKSISYLFSTNYENEYTIRKGVDRTFYQAQGDYDNNLQRSQYRFQTTNSTLLGLAYKTTRAKLNFNTLYIHSSDNMIQDQLGYTRNNVQQPNQLIRLNQYEQSDYVNIQLYGTYSLTEDDKHSIKGGLSFTNTKWQQPDRKFLDVVKVDDTNVQLRYGGNNLLRQFFTIDGTYFLSGIAEYNYKFGTSEDTANQHKLSIGYNGYVNEMETSYRFVFGKPANSPPISIAPFNEIDAILETDNNAGYFNYQEESTPDYMVKISQNIHSGYANLFMKPSNVFEFNIGVRAESTNRELQFRTLRESFRSPFKTQNTTKLDILPSINTKYSLNETTNLRFAASKTLTRPVLMEAIPIQYINADGTSELGNPGLENSTNYNVDIKYEVFPTPDELFAATLFGKFIDKPIERTIQANATGAGQIITYYNNENATLFGVELEALVQLSRLTDALTDFSFGVNTSIMYSNSKVDKNRTGYFDTFEERKLQGASDWMANADIKYEFNINENWRNTMSLVYNVYGERIYAVGVAFLDHIYENPFHKLDFVWSQNINNDWEVKFSVDNILNQTYSQELGSESQIEIREESRTLRDFKRGVGFSMNVAYTF